MRIRLHGRLKWRFGIHISAHANVHSLQRVDGKRVWVNEILLQTRDVLRSPQSSARMGRAMLLERGSICCGY